MGSNPENVLDGPRKGMRLLGEVEDAGRKMMASLSADQKKKAIIADTVPKDIFTEAKRKAVIENFQGIPAAEMTPAQKTVLMDLIKEYANRLRSELATKDLEKIEKRGLDKIYFAWIGTEELRQPHYYRVHGPTFVIEYDNIQNNNNHVHSVWRDFENDFGEDLLKKHNDESHSAPK